MGHGGKIGSHDASIDVFTHGQREPRFQSYKLGRLDHLAQPDGLALAVRYLDSNCRLARHALDENAFRTQAQAEVLGHAGDAVVFDAGLRLEFVSRNYRTGIDMRDLSRDVEFAELIEQVLG